MNRINGVVTAQNIGLVIKNKRIEKGLSQDELSKRANISRTFLNLVENGHRKPSINTLEVIASKLDKDVSILITEAMRGDGDPKLKLAYLLAKLQKSQDDGKLTKLLEFVSSLDSDSLLIDDK
jgi:transcriptional regulator with XRE-family HTH domain